MEIKRGVIYWLPVGTFMWKIPQTQKGFSMILLGVTKHNKYPLCSLQDPIQGHKLGTLTQGTEISRAEKKGWDKHTNVKGRQCFECRPALFPKCTKASFVPWPPAVKLLGMALPLPFPLQLPGPPCLHLLGILSSPVRSPICPTYHYSLIVLKVSSPLSLLAHTQNKKNKKFQWPLTYCLYHPKSLA